MLFFVCFSCTCNKKKIQFFPDNFVRREIKRLDVICHWSQSGCEWNGELNDYYSVSKCCVSVLLVIVVVSTLNVIMSICRYIYVILELRSLYVYMYDHKLLLEFRMLHLQTYHGYSSGVTGKIVGHWEDSVSLGR